MPPGAPGRERLDVVLVRRGLAPTRAKAQALVIAGRVTSDGARLDKPGQRVPGDIALAVLDGPRHVSRGAIKLEAAVAAFGVKVSGRDAIDVGSSTGGFTEILLREGARRVVALDVGRGQLDWSLRKDERVYVVEGVNARHLQPSVLPFPPSLATVDVSFISLHLVLPPVLACLTRPGEVVALVKPQFEVGRRQVGRGGIVRDVGLHREVLRTMLDFIHAHGWCSFDVRASSLRGAEGNQEYFIHFATDGPRLSDAEAERRVARAVEAPEAGS